MKKTTTKAMTCHTKFKMLKENGTADDAAENDGSVMRETLAKFWDTFYL